MKRNKVTDKTELTVLFIEPKYTWGFSVWQNCFFKAMGKINYLIGNVETAASQLYEDQAVFLP